MAKLLYGWGNKKYDREYWRRWKKNPFSRYSRNPFLKRMEEKEEDKGRKIKEWDEEVDEEDQWRLEEDRKYLEELEDENQDMEDLRNPYDEL